MSFDLRQMDDDEGDGKPFSTVNFIHLAKAGNEVPAHVHDWKHLTVVARGAALFQQDDDGEASTPETLAAIELLKRIRPDLLLQGKMIVLPRPGMSYDGIVTPPNVMHRIVATMDDTLVLCINRSERFAKYLA